MKTAMFSLLTSTLRRRQDALPIVDAQRAHELELAHRVQKQFLKVPPPIPGLDIAVVNLPAATVSGDFYDFLPAGPGHLVAVGDVAGHGIGAALTMSAALTAVELSLRAAHSHGAFADDRGRHGLFAEEAAGEALCQLVQEVDNFLTVRLGGESFITAFFALYYKEGLITLNLGHPPGIVYLAKSGKVWPLRSRDKRYLPLMALRDVSANLAMLLSASMGFSAQTVFNTGLGASRSPQFWPLKVQPGDALVLYTDGLIEARNGKALYGVRRLRRKVQELGNRPAQEIVAGVLADVRAFTGGREQRDDITLVVVRKVDERSLG